MKQGLAFLWVIFLLVGFCALEKAAAQEEGFSQLEFDSGAADKTAKKKRPASLFDEEEPIFKERIKRSKTYGTGPAAAPEESITENRWERVEKKAQYNVDKQKTGAKEIKVLSTEDLLKALEQAEKDPKEPKTPVNEE